MTKDLPSRAALVEHLLAHAVRTDGPFTLRSGAVSDYYIDARQTTFDGTGARLVGRAIVDALPVGVDAVGGLTMGADPLAVAASIVDGSLRAFSIRKAPKEHGTGGRLVGPVAAGDRVVVLDDTVTTGGALAEAIEVARAEALDVVGALVLVDRSGSAVAERMESLGIPYRALLGPRDLGLT